MAGLGRAGGRRCWGVGVGVGVWAVVIAQACLACLAIRPGSCSGRLQGAGPLLRDVAVPLARADRAHWGCMANQRRVGSTTGGAQRPQSGSALCRLTRRPRLVAEVRCFVLRRGAGFTQVLLRLRLRLLLLENPDAPLPPPVALALALTLAHHVARSIPTYLLTYLPRYIDYLTPRCPGCPRCSVSQPILLPVQHTRSLALSLQRLPNN